MLRAGEEEEKGEDDDDQEDEDEAESSSFSDAPDDQDEEEEADSSSLLDSPGDQAEKGLDPSLALSSVSVLVLVGPQDAGLKDAVIDVEKEEEDLSPPDDAEEKELGLTAALDLFSSAVADFCELGDHPDVGGGGDDDEVKPLPLALKVDEAPLFIPLPGEKEDDEKDDEEDDEESVLSSLP